MSNLVRVTAPGRRAGEGGETRCGDILYQLSDGHVARRLCGDCSDGNPQGCGCVLERHPVNMRTGHIQTKDATLSHYRSVPVRFEDGRIEYLVGDTAHHPSGWASLPTDLIPMITWHPEVE